MKRLLALATLIAATMVMVSCSDDDGGTAETFDAPTVTAPSAGNVENGSTGNTLAFSVSTDADIADAATYTVTSSANITPSAASGTVDGSSVTVTFDATTDAGAAFITLTVTDGEGQSAEGTAVFEVNELGDNSVEISGIPTTATVVDGGTLSVTGVSITAEDGLADFSATVNGGSAIDLTTLSGFTAGETSATVDLSFTTAELGAVVGNNEIVFTATDSDGDEGVATHILTVAEIGFDITEIDDLDSNGDGEATAEPAKEIAGSINADLTFTADVTWVLAGRVKVVDGATLTIEPGTVIKGRAGTGQNSTALLVARGAYIEAVGTAALPIIMTSVDDELLPSDVASGNYVGSIAEDVNGLWGGLIVLGDATISASADEVQIEGIPTSDLDGLYGGSNDDDDSGTISYVSVRHGGTNIGSGNEINGITFGGVGSGTTVSWIEVVANQDDGIEWFGGSVDASNVVVWNAGDDGLDSDQDWIGDCTNFFVLTPDGSGFELDGPEGPDARGTHQFDNGVVYAGTAIDHLVDWDATTNAGLSNIYFLGLDASLVIAGDFSPVESFGGDGSGTNSNWEVTLAGGTTLADVFGTISIVSSVAANANTVGPQNATGFEWTLSDSMLTAAGF